MSSFFSLWTHWRIVCRECEDHDSNHSLLRQMAARKQTHSVESWFLSTCCHCTTWSAKPLSTADWVTCSIITLGLRHPAALSNTDYVHASCCRVVASCLGWRLLFATHIIIFMHKQHTHESNHLGWHWSSEWDRGTVVISMTHSELVDLSIPTLDNCQLLPYDTMQGQKSRSRDPNWCMSWMFIWSTVVTKCKKCNTKTIHTGQILWHLIWHNST